MSAARATAGSRRTALAARWDRLGGRRWVWPLAVLASVGLLLSTWAAGMPRFAFPDEVSHVVKAYATGQGVAIGDEIPGADSLTRAMPTPRDLATDEAACFAFHPDVPAACPQPTDPTVVPTRTTAAKYPPAYYAVVGGLARALGASHSLPVYRFLSLAIAAVVIAGALTILSRLGRDAAALALPALTPMAVFMCAGVNPTSWEISGMLLLWCLLTWLRARPEPPSTRHLLAVSAIAGVLVLARPVTLPWIAAAAVAYLALDRRLLAAPRRATLRRLSIAAIPMLVGIAGSMVWSRRYDVALNDQKFVYDWSRWHLFRTGIGQIGSLYEQLIGVLGWLDTRIPFAALVAWTVAFAATAVVCWLRGPRLLRRVMVGLLAFWLLYPAVYVTIGRMPYVWSGRYNLPILGGFTLCAAELLRSDLTRALVHRLARLFAAVFVIAEVLAFYQALRRFMVGSLGDELLDHPAWRPAIHPWLLIAVNLLAAASLVGLVLNRPEPRPR